MSILSDLIKSGLTAAEIIEAVQFYRQSTSGLSANQIFVPGVGTSSFLDRSRSNNYFPMLWVKITGNATGGGKYTGKSYTHDGTTDVAATGNVAESELGTLSDEVDCRVLNFAEEGESTHDLTAGTPEIDTFLCHWFRTNSDGIKVCAVVAFDRATCA